MGDPESGLGPMAGKRGDSQLWRSPDIPISLCARQGAPEATLAPSRDRGHRL